MPKLHKSAASLGVALVLTLAGCTVPQDDIAATMVNGSPEFAICDGFEANQFRVLVSPKAVFESDLEEAWVASGQAESFFEAGTRIAYAVAPIGMTTIVGGEPLDTDGLTLQLYAEQLDVRGEMVGRTVFGQFDGDRLSAGSWLQQDGRQTTEPCS